jgi:hypothetical protein
MEADRRRIAEVLPAYEVGVEIGRGAWGVVYAGHHRHLARGVAIKQLPTAFGADPGVRARFISEARLVASLDHPHIVPVYDYVEREGLYLIVMEHLSGGTLWQRFNGEGIALDEAVAMILAVCAALGYAHERGILHRDVKPDNLLLATAGTPKLTDFGIAKLLSSTRTALTLAGTAIGTPAYMAPEQAQGSSTSPATDVYACAVMLYELFAGTLPFPEFSDPVTQLYQHVHERPRPLGEAAPATPVGLCDVTMRALAKSPEDRYESAEELGVALAKAATAAWGPGWVGRTDITVMDRGRISAATQQAVPGSRGPGAPATVIVRGTGIDHPVLEPVTEDSEPFEEVGGLAIRADQARTQHVAAPSTPAMTTPPTTAPPTEAIPPAPTAPPTTAIPPAPPVGEPPPPAQTEPLESVVPPRWAVLAPLPPSEDGRHSGRRRLAPVVAAVLAILVVAAAVASVLAFLPAGGSDEAPSQPGGTDTSSTSAPETTEASPPPDRTVEIDDIGLEGNRYLVLYTVQGFTPRIAEDDPTQHHVHFFWDIYEPTQAGTNAADFGATVGQWELWDQQVFDGFTQADRPAGATRICAVVGTHDHQVDNPQNHSCVALPA